MFYILIAIISGVTNVISRSVNFALSEKIGVYQSTLFNYIFGLIGSLGILFVSGEAAKLFAASSYGAPWMAYLGGLVGVAVVSLQVFLSSKVSSFYLTLLIFVGQLFMGIIIDCVVSGQISIPQILGGLLVVLGLGYNLFLDREKEAEVVLN